MRNIELTGEEVGNLVALFDQLYHARWSNPPDFTVLDQAMSAMGGLIDEWQAATEPGTEDDLDLN